MRQLTDDAEHAAAYPVWSPDGSKIAYWSQRTDGMRTVDADLDSPVLVGEPVTGGAKLAHLRFQRRVVGVRHADGTHFIHLRRQQVHERF